MAIKQRNFIIACFFMVFTAIWITQFVMTVPAMAGPELPPRHPTKEPAPNDDDDNGGIPAGAYIELHSSGVPSGAWSVVQWVDTAGNWHDVEGWTASMETTEQKHWVASHDFGKGPFRWQVRHGPTGPVLASSETFLLPLRGNETVVISIEKK